MKNSDGRLVGILGAVIIHLLAGIIFMSFQLKTLKVDFPNEYLVELEPAEVPALKEKLIEIPVTTLEKILQGDEEMMNIARNLANKSEEKINPDDYIDKVKEELIKSGKLSADNYIDEKKISAEKNDDEKPSIENEAAQKNKINQPDKSQEMASNFKGPTRIYYDLAGRTHTYLPIPIYKCQGSGKVVLEINVNMNGIVEKAQIIAKESTTSDPCLVETAVTTALISRFNSDYKSLKIQTGTLTYHFVAQ